MKNLTAIQDDTYQFIKRYIEQHGQSPSVREMCDHYDVSTKTCQDRINALKRKGFITAIENTPRSIKLTRYNMTVTLDEKPGLE